MRRILLAVSGGIDSMYLANRAPELFPGAVFAVAHCNFALRGEESDGDEEFVRSWRRDNGLVCFTKRFDRYIEIVIADQQRYQLHQTGECELGAGCLLELNQ